MKRKLFFYVPRLLLAMALSIALSLAGIYLLPAAGAIDGILAAVAIVCLVLIGLCYLISPIAAKRYLWAKRHSVQQTQQELMARSEHIRADYKRARRELHRRKAWIVGYVIVILLMTTYIAIVSYRLSIGVTVLTAFVYFGLFCRVHSAYDLIDFSQYSDPEAYPALHGLARRAATAMGVRGTVRILFVYDNSAAIARQGKNISLRLGVRLLSYMTAEELYAVLLHEFAHIKNTDTDIAYDHRFVSFLTEELEEGIYRILGALFYFPAVWYSFELTMYQQMSSVVLEELADRAMADQADHCTAASAFAKMECFSWFEADLADHMGRSFYESEECPVHLLTDITDTFRRVFPANRELWLSRMNNEIQSRSATHPVMRDRLAPLGGVPATIELSEEMPQAAEEREIREEICRAMQDCDKEVCESLKESYTEGRQENYLKPLATVEAWEAAGKAYDPNHVKEIMEALLALNRRKDATELCEDILANHSGGAADYAHFIRGNIRLDEYDHDGIEDLYAAAESNSNYIESAMDRIGAYCCAMGLGAQLEEYRARVTDFYQRKVDEDAVGDLNGSCDLSSETALEESLRARNLEFMIRVGEGHIHRIYLVHWKKTETLSRSAYIIEFKPETTGEQVEKVMDQIFEMLDHCPEDWNYSLSLYDKDTAAAARRVPGSMIYDADNQN